MNPLLPAVILLALGMLFETVALVCMIAAWHETDRWQP